MKKNKKNSSEKYWRVRVLEDEAIKEKRGQEQAKLQEEAYKIALLEIQGTIRKYERMFVENNFLGNIQEANKLLNSEELEEYKWDVYKYIKEAERYANTKDKHTPEMIKLDTQLRNSSLKYRIGKQEALKKIVESKLLNLAQRNIHTLTNDLKLQANITVDNVKSDFMKQNIPLKNDIDISKVENKVLDEKWVDNKRYSERIWKNTKELGSHIEKEVQKAIILGKNPKTLIKALKERFKVETWKAKRLALTEMSYSLNKSRMLTFLSQGVEKVVLIATLDLRTSKICINKNNKVVKLKGAKQGIDLPPFHPHCRTVFVPVIDFLEDTNFYDNEDEDLIDDDIVENPQTNILNENNTAFKQSSDYLEYKNIAKLFEEKGVPEKYIPKTFEMYIENKNNEYYKEIQNIKENVLNRTYNNFINGVYKETKFKGEVKKAIERKFGELETDAIILRDERIEHIKERHEVDVDVIKENFEKIIGNPTAIYIDKKYEDTVLMLEDNLGDKPIQLVIKLILKNGDTELKNSVITGYSIRKRIRRKLDEQYKKIY